jgi:RHS repeat-associated protein
VRFSSSVADDPLVMHSRLESFRTDSQRTYSGSYGGYGSLCDVGHQGLLHDKEFGPAATGLVHNRARTLNPNLGRFNQRDHGHIKGATRLTGKQQISQYRDGLGLHTYAKGNPLRYLDTSGNSTLHALQTLGMWAKSLDDLKNDCGQVYAEVTINYNADWDDTNKEITDNLSKLFKKDTWFYHGHTAARGNKILGIVEHDTWSQGEIVPTKALSKAMNTRHGNHAPGLVVLASCKSCDMRKTFLQRGAKCVACYRKSLESGNAAIVAMAFMKHLCEGDTIACARDKANKKKGAIRGLGVPLSVYCSDSISMRKDTLHHLTGINVKKGK